MLIDDVNFSHLADLTANEVSKCGSWLREALLDLTDVTRLNFFEVARAAFFSKY